MSSLSIDTILFDAGGTLLHPAEPIGRTYARVAKRFGVELDPLTIDARFRQAWKQLHPRLPGTVPRDGDDRIWWRELVRQTVTAKESWPLELVFEDYFQALYTEYEAPEAWLLYPEVEETLETLFRREFRMAVLSNWDRRLRTILHGHHLSSFFSEIFISSEMGMAKPSRSFYQRALRILGAEPSTTLMVGDEPAHDELPAQQEGLSSLIIQRPEQDLGRVLDFLMI